MFLALLPRQDGLFLTTLLLWGPAVEPAVALRQRCSAPQEGERDEDRQHPLHGSRSLA